MKKISLKDTSYNTSRIIEHEKKRKEIKTYLDNWNKGNIIKQVVFPMGSDSKNNIEESDLKDSYIEEMKVVSYKKENIPNASYYGLNRKIKYNHFDSHTITTYLFENHLDRILYRKLVLNYSRVNSDTSEKTLRKLWEKQNTPLSWEDLKEEIFLLLWEKEMLCNTDFYIMVAGDIFFSWETIKEIYRLIDKILYSAKRQVNNIPLYRDTDDGQVLVVTDTMKNCHYSQNDILDMINDTGYVDMVRFIQSHSKSTDIYKQYIGLIIGRLQNMTQNEIAINLGISTHTLSKRKKDLQKIMIEYANSPIGISCKGII